MKIFHVITSLKIGGAESALLNFLEKDLKINNNNHIVAYFYSGPNLKKIKNLKIKTYQIKGKFYKYDYWAYKNLKNIIIKNNPDIIHSALWSSNVLSKIVAKKLNIPIICDLHSNIQFDGNIRKLIEEPTLFYANKYIAVSNSAKEGFLKTYKNKSKELKQRVIVINNGIEINNQQLNPLTKKDLGFNANDFIIGAVGRLEKIKSYNLLIKSFAIVINKINKPQKIKLCIVGNGSEKKKLERLVLNLNIKKHVIFTGMRQDVKNIYPIFDIFIISSKSEGLSIALLEAISFGLPIITTCQQKNHDIIKNKINGLIVKPENEFELSKAIKKLYFDKNLLTNIKNNNYNLLRPKLSIDLLISEYNKIYKELILNQNNGIGLKFKK